MAPLWFVGGFWWVRFGICAVCDVLLLLYLFSYIYLDFFSSFVSFFFSLPQYVCLLAKLACQVKFKQILLEQLCLFMGKWLDPLTVSILNFYAFIFMTVILMKKHFKPPLKWRKYHSSTLIHTHAHLHTQTSTQTQTQTRTQSEPQRQAHVATQTHIQTHSLFCIHISVYTMGVFIAKPMLYACTYLGFKISDRFVLTFTHFSSAAYDGICGFVCRQADITYLALDGA